MITTGNTGLVVYLFVIRLTKHLSEYKFIDVEKSVSLIAVKELSLFQFFFECLRYKLAFIQMLFEFLSVVKNSLARLSIERTVKLKTDLWDGLDIELIAAT
jgi:hypothetical protein